MQKEHKRQCDDVQWEREPECLGPKRNRVLGGGKRASERVNRPCDERLLEAVRLDVVAPGLAASEERHGAGRLRSARGSRHSFVVGLEVHSDTKPIGFAGSFPYCGIYM